jgi:hypothetical protein
MAAFAINFARPRADFADTPSRRHSYLYSKNGFLVPRLLGANLIIPN